MRRITLWLLSTVAAVVLLFSYRTSTSSGGTAAATAVSGGAGAPPARPDPATAPRPAATASSSGTSGSNDLQRLGRADPVGPVQVTITVAGGKITDVAVPIYPDGNGRDRRSTPVRLPILTQETLAAQSADIDTVSGATVTSDGYKESLQAALDAAHLS